MRGSLSRPGVFHTFRWKLTRIERYVVIRSLLAVLAALGVISALIMLIDFVNVSRNVGVKVDIPAVQVLYLTLLKAPNDILLLLPFAFLFGVLGAFVGLNRRSELVAMRAAGVSAWRFIFPAAGAAFVIGWFVILAVNPVASWMNGRYETEAQRLATGVSAAQSQSVWLRQGDGRTQVVIHARAKPAGGDTLQDVSFFIYTIGDRGQPGVLAPDRGQVRRAPQGLLADLLRRPRGGARRAGGALRDPVDPGATLQPCPPPTTSSPAAPSSVPFWSLPRVIHGVQAAGFSATTYSLKLQQLLAIPLLFAAMSILGAAFSLRLMRLGGLAVLTSSGVALGFVIFFFNPSSAESARQGGCHCYTGACRMAPPQSWRFLSAFTLLCYTAGG